MDYIEAEDLIKKIIKLLEDKGEKHYDVTDSRKDKQRYKRMEFSIRIE